MLKDKLKPVICNKTRLLSKTVFLHHNSACLHVTTATLEKIWNLKFEVLPHLYYSPDLAPCDFHAFDALTEALHCRQFGSDEEEKEVVHTWIREQPKNFFSNGIKKLVDRYKKCVEMRGNYVEK
jgi:histone-lysine N-methyltransferase SETMAR